MASDGEPGAGRPVYFLVHVPKCAGTTVEAYVTRRFADAILLPTRRRSPRRHFGPKYVLPEAIEFDRVEFVIGHNFTRALKHRFPGRPIREAVLLRDPVGHMFSHYNSRLRRYRRHGWTRYDFADFYRGRVANPISHFILNRYLEIPTARLAILSDARKFRLLEDLLAGFWHVGGHADVGHLIGKIAKAKGTPAGFETKNVGRAPDMDRDAFVARYEMRIRAEHALDQALFDRFCTGGRADTTALRGGIANLVRELKRPALSARARLKRNHGI